VSLAVAPGELFGLLGPNGSGKSTLFKVLATLVAPDSGTARILGHDVVREGAVVRRRLGVVFQHPSVDGKLTVEENLLHQGYLYGLSGTLLRRRAAEVLQGAALWDRRFDRVDRLSGGLQRRTELAKALLVGAQVLLLDEPSSGLDPGARGDFLTDLRRLRETEGITVVLTTHDMEEAERCDRVAILDQGRLVALDTPEALRAAIGGDVLVMQATSPEVLREKIHVRFGLDASVVNGMLRLERARGHELVRELVDAFPDDVQAITYGKPTLGDVFVRLTGRRLSDAAAGA
jgi:ABC-2 type transport system ATP-binding protein